MFNMFNMFKPNSIKRSINLGIIILSVSLLTACAKKTLIESDTTKHKAQLEKTAKTPTVTSQGSNEQLTGTWQVELIKTRPVIDRSPARFILLAKNKLSGSASCNNISSHYRANQSKNTLTFGPTAVTRKLCAPALMEQETRLLSTLPQVKHYQIKYFHNEQNMLYLFDKNDVLMFKASKVN